MQIRFGKIVATPVGVSPYWDLEVSGADIQKHQPILDKFGFKSKTSEPIYSLALEPKMSHGSGKPGKLKVQDRDPDAGDIAGLNNLIAEAEPNPGYYNPNGLFEQDKAAMHQGLLNTAVHLLTQQGGDLRYAISQVVQLLKK